MIAVRQFFVIKSFETWWKTTIHQISEYKKLLRVIRWTYKTTSKIIMIGFFVNKNKPKTWLTNMCNLISLSLNRILLVRHQLLDIKFWNNCTHIYAFVRKQNSILLICMPDLYILYVSNFELTSNRHFRKYILSSHKSYKLLCCCSCR